MIKNITLSLQIVLVVLSGVLVPFCFPPVGWWLLILLSFSLLFIAIAKTTPRRAFYLGMFQGTIGYGITLSWFFHIFSGAAIVLFTILAFFTALFCLLFNILAKNVRSDIFKVFIAATLWTAIEFYRAELFFLSFPWITFGSAFGPTFLSPILGVYSMSFLIIVASVGLIKRRTFPIGLIISLLVVCLGIFNPGRIEPDKNNSITVAAVQSEECVIDSYVELTRTVLNKSPDLIIWPEYSLPYDVRKNVKDFEALISLCEEMDAILVVGTKTIIGPGDGDWHNTALVLDKYGVIGEYYKIHPVHFFNDGIQGTTFNPIKTNKGTFATPICFDCDYSEVSRKMVRLNAEYFAVPSFDSESWSVNQHLQHAALFRLRAVENARWLACSASSGVSQIIDPNGNVHISLPPMKTGVITYSIERSNRLTFFTRVGWMFPWLTVVCSVILFAYMGIKVLICKKKYYYKYGE